MFLVHREIEGPMMNEYLCGATGVGDVFLQNVGASQPIVHKKTPNTTPVFLNSIEHLFSYLVATKGWQIQRSMRECAKLK